MTKKQCPALAVILLLLAIGCLTAGEWGLCRIKPLLEYAAPCDPSRQSTEHADSPLLSALAQLREALPEADVSAFMLRRGLSIQAASGREAECSVYSVATGWFDLYHRALHAGRLLGEREIAGGERVALVNERLAYALWGDTTVTEQFILLDGEPFRVVGVVRHEKAPGQTEPNELYIPLSAAVEMGLDGDIQVLASNGKRQTVYFAAASSVLPGGTGYSLEKERARAELPLRCLVVLFMLTFLSWFRKLVNRLNRRRLDAWKARHALVYGKEMIRPSLRLAALCLAGYGLWLVAAYITLQLAIAPAAIFREWIPDDPSRLSSYGNAIRGALEQQMVLHSTSTENVLSMRFYGGLIRIGSIAGLIAGSLRGGRVRACDSASLLCLRS